MRPDPHVHFGTDTRLCGEHAALLGGWLGEARREPSLEFGDLTNWLCVVRCTPPREDGGACGSHYARKLLVWHEPLVEHFNEQSVALFALEVDELNEPVIFPSALAAAKLTKAIINGVLLVGLQWHSGTVSRR